MIGCLRTRVRKQPIIALYSESKNELKFYNLEACTIAQTHQSLRCSHPQSMNVDEKAKGVCALRGWLFGPL